MLWRFIGRFIDHTKANPVAYNSSEREKGGERERERMCLNKILLSIWESEYKVGTRKNHRAECLPPCEILDTWYS